MYNIKNNPCIHDDQTSSHLLVQRICLQQRQVLVNQSSMWTPEIIKITINVNWIQLQNSFTSLMHFFCATDSMNNSIMLDTDSMTNLVFKASLIRFLCQEK